MTHTSRILRSVILRRPASPHSSPVALSRVAWPGTGKRVIDTRPPFPHKEFPMIRSVQLPRLLAALACSISLASGALAETRDSATFINVNSDLDPTGSAGSGSLLVTGTYDAQYITLSGTLAEVNTNTFAHEAVVRVFAPSGDLVAVLKPFAIDGGGGPYSTSTYVYKLPAPIAANGTWNFRFNELYDDSGVDSRWTSVTISLNDGPPRVNTSAIFIFPGPSGYNNMSVCGTIARGFTLQNQLVQAGDTRWYKIEVPYPVDTTGFSVFTFNGYMDIDTEGSTGFDFELALYDVDGNRLANDDDTGSGNQAQLSFGTAANRPAIGAGAVYNNRNGTLKPGSYYIAVSAFNATFGSVGWNTSSNSTTNETFNLNVRTNIRSSPFCPSDYNRGGSTSLQDIFDFLTDWFSGC